MMERLAYTQKGGTCLKSDGVIIQSRAHTLKLDEVKMKEGKMKEEQTKQLLELLMRVIAKAISKPRCQKRNRSIEHSWKLEKRFSEFITYYYKFIYVSNSIISGNN